MKNRLSPTTTTRTTERCVELKIILPSSGKLRVNESVLIPEGTPVDAAANTADINRLQSERLRRKQKLSTAAACSHSQSMETVTL